ncbi:unnamed protein product [Cyclocybe aegerita]|uniref:Uncharacterized protein n=1 Tax=Cyclocybe aegerita TaxID=1973307 RepID=A0A8S0W5E5_CYCAE|nr:unnamed protein product [Cyclocybe aegerita]
MKLTDLAQELVDLIVDALLYGDPKLLSSSTRHDLRTCLFVTQMTRCRAGQHLFRSIRISDEQDEDVLTSLKTLLQLISPNTTSGRVGIASFVKELSVKFVRLDAEGFLDNNETLIPQIFDALDAPQYGSSSLSLSFPPRSHSFGLNLEERPEALQKSFYKLLHSPHLRTLSLENICGFSATIFHGSHIETLRLKNTGYKDWDNTDKFHKILRAAESRRVPRGEISHLRTLDIDNSAPLHPFRSEEGLQLHQLDSFVGNIHEIAHLRNVGMVIRQAKKIKIISFHFLVNDDAQLSPIPGSLNLRDLSNLKHLEIVIPRHTPSNSMPDGIDSIAEILDMPIPPDPLITFEIKIKMPMVEAR